MWRDAKLPEDEILIPGTLDSCSNYVEHPELAAQRIERYAELVGEERVIAGADCGFGAFAGYGKMDTEISYKKLRSLTEGCGERERKTVGEAGGVAMAIRSSEPLTATIDCCAQPQRHLRARGGCSL